MIPYLHVPDAHLGPLTIHPFGVLVALAVVVGTALASRRARAFDLDPEQVQGFVTVVLVFGFVGGHVVDALLYQPREVLARPLHLLAIWEGQGSFGGFIGAVLGALAWKHVELVRLGGTLPRVRRRAAPRPVLPLVDWLVSVFPVAWILGRLGCAVAHDHPGARASASAIFAVGYGPVDAARVLHGPLGVELRWGSAPRYDLGLLECAFAALMSLALVAAWRRRWPTGFYAAVVPLAYAPVRFALDFLRVSEAEGGDARYAGLTPAQWSCIALAAVSSVALFRLTSRATSRLAAARSGRGEARRGMPLG